MNGDGDARVLDLTAPVSRPVKLAHHTESISVDQEWVARTLLDDDDETSRIEVRALPFGHRHHPRILGTLAGPRIHPGAPWRPQFDATGPLNRVRLTIRDAKGRTVQVLHGAPAPDGSVRDLSWNGLRRSGKRVPGRYSWTLTAGRFLVPSNVDGRATTGTVTVL